MAQARRESTKITLLSAGLLAGGGANGAAGPAGAVGASSLPEVTNTTLLEPEEP
jgi:hypothetical protein